MTSQLNNPRLPTQISPFAGSVEAPPRAGEFHDSGALTALYKDTAKLAFQPLWNLVGRPAMMFPWGVDDNGIPFAAQFGARPNEEGLLLALGAQLERRRGPAGPPPEL